MRQRAVGAFGFDLAEVAERSRLAFAGYEEGTTQFYPNPLCVRTFSPSRRTSTRMS